MIDVDRGCEIRRTPEGVSVFMYIDQPGVFYNEHGVEVGAKAAQMAGFAVDTLLRERKKREAILAAGKTIAESYQETEREVVAESGDYRIVHIGSERYNVEFSDGSVMNLNGPVSLAVAQKIMEALQPMPDPAPTEVSAKEPGKPAKA